MGCTQSTSHTREPVESMSSPKSSRRSMNPLTDLEIQSRIEASKSVQTLEIDGVKMRYAFMSQRGYYPEGECHVADGIDCLSLFCINHDSFLIMTFSFGQGQSRCIYTAAAIRSGQREPGVLRCLRWSRQRRSLLCSLRQRQCKQHTLVLSFQSKV